MKEPYSQFENYMYWKYLARKYFWPIFLVSVALIFLASSFYTVASDEVGLILRFGKYAGTYDPGLHFKLPFGIDRVHKVQVMKMRTEEFGFRTKTPGVQSSFKSQGYTEESLMLSGDLNMAEVAWIVQYRISEPKDYLFSIREKEKNLRDVAETVIRQIVGDKSIDEVLTIGREEIEEEAKIKMQAIFNSYHMGVTVSLVKLQNVTPPKPVAPSFNEVNEARQEKEQKINKAYTEFNKTIPQVEGEAEKIVSQAEGYAIEKVNIAKGDVAKFDAICEEYIKAKKITQTRLYLETMGEIYRKAGKKIVIDENLRSIVPLLDLERLK